MGRYFIAINIPEDSAEPFRLAQEHLPEGGVRYTKTNHFHVTFKFLGEVNDTKLLEVQLAVKNLLASVSFSKEDLQLEWSRTGLFFKHGRPAVIQVGVKLSKALYQFQRDLEEVLASLGFPSERKRFRPHVTLARIREIKRHEQNHLVEEMKRVGVQRQMFQAENLVLMESHLSKDRPPDYTVVEPFLFAS